MSFGELSPRTTSPKLNPEVHAIAKWLHRHWNPIGGVPEDEYESYSLSLYSMLIHKAAAEEIAARLSEFQDGMACQSRPTNSFPSLGSC